MDRDQERVARGRQTARAHACKLVAKELEAEGRNDQVGRGTRRLHRRCTGGPYKMWGRRGRLGEIEHGDEDGKRRSRLFDAIRRGKASVFLRGPGAAPARHCHLPAIVIHCGAAGLLSGRHVFNRETAGRQHREDREHHRRRDRPHRPQASQHDQAIFARAGRPVKCQLINRTQQAKSISDDD
jgi:hypothetical protein